MAINKKPETSRLTAKQEKFAQCIADGMTQADAYREVYSAKNMSDSTVWANASRIANNSKVIARVDSLRSEVAKRQLWTRENSVKALIRVYVDNDTPAAVKVSAVRELNNMHGYNEPVKHELSGPDGGPIPTMPTMIELVAPQIDDKSAD